jgi:hypothetical protein
MAAAVEAGALARQQAQAVQAVVEQEILQVAQVEMPPLILAVVVAAVEQVQVVLEVQAVQVL